MNKPISTSVFNLMLWLLLRLMTWVVVGSICSFAVAIVIIAVCGSASGLDKLQQLLISTTTYVNQLQIQHHFLADIDAMQAAASQSAIAAHLPISFIHSKKVNSIIVLLKPYMMAMSLSGQLLLLRLTVLLKALSLVILLGLVGLVDGLTQRSIRRFNAARESALFYHQAKNLMSFSLIVGIFFYLVLPSVQLAQMMLWGAIMIFGVAVQLTAKSFKKYL